MKTNWLKNYVVLKRIRAAFLLLLLLVFNLHTNLARAEAPGELNIFAIEEESKVVDEKHLLQTVVQGTVTDENGLPLPGVTVLVQGTNIGTVTGMEGDYSLEVPATNAVLIFSYLGFATQKIPVGQENVINVQLQQEAAALEELVVVGYGKQSRETITTSISKLDPQVLENIPYANAASAMQGTIPGVRVQSTSGQPGAAPRVIIRGGTSINNPNGASPLYIVDGVVRPQMVDISPDAIESLQVLKDAASTAIYGARGSNGVVIITTKSGQAGEMRISYNYDLTFSEVGKTYDLASARDYLTMARRAMLVPDKFPDLSFMLQDPTGFGTGNDLTNNTGFTTQYLTPENEHKLDEGWESMPDPLDPSKTLIFKETDWQDVLFRTAISHNHHITISGGSEKATFHAGIGYLNNQGIAITTEFKRYTFNLNGEIKANDNLNFFGQVLYSRSSDNHVTPNNASIFARAATLPPTTKYKFEDGSLAPGANISEGNPAYILTRRENENTNDNLTMILGANWEILPDLTFDPQVSVYNVYSDNYTFQPSILHGPGNLVDTRRASGGSYRWQQIQADAVFSYKKSFMSAHNLETTAGVSYFSRKESKLGAVGRGAATDLIPTLNASAEPVSVSSEITDQVILGYFGRINYNYRYKYLLSLTMRYDGASNLGKNHKWGLFPGVSVGWNLHQEEFWEIFPEEFSRLKLRASYGENGNIGALGDFSAQGVYSVGEVYAGNPAIRNTTLPNEELKWEESKTFNIGADIGLFNGRINVLFDAYRRVTENLITNYTLPPSTGFGGILTNLGSLENKGVEVELDVQVLPTTSDFQWNFSFNAAKVKNKILSLPPNGAENNRVGGVYIWNADIGDYSWQGGLQEGGAMGELFAYQQEGIFATDEEALGAPVDQIMTIADRTKYGGDVKWADRDNNGIIDARDRAYMGNIFPVWTGGFTNTFGYKNLFLTVRLDYTTGHTIYNYTRAFMNGMWKTNMNLTQEMVENSWKEQGDDTYLPRYYWNGDRGQQNIIRGNSEYYESGDFLAIREVTLSYTFPSKLVERLNLDNIRLNITGSNLYYFTKYKGLNPEEGGRDYGRYPIPRNIIFGAKILF